MSVHKLTAESVMITPATCWARPTHTSQHRRSTCVLKYYVYLATYPWNLYTVPSRQLLRGASSVFNMCQYVICTDKRIGTYIRIPHTHSLQQQIHIIMPVK